MKVSAKASPERRSDSRIYTNAKIRYKVNPDDNYESAILDNISGTGALVWMEQDLSIGTQFELRVDSDDDTQKPIVLIVEIVRLVSDKQDDKAGYGCSIKQKP